MSEALAQQLFADYRDYVQSTAWWKKKQAEHYMRLHKETPERLALLESMIVWCREQGVDPRLWLYSLFRSRRWIYPPKIQVGHLQSMKHLPKYRRMLEEDELTYYRERTHVQPKLEPLPEFDPIEEGIKRRRQDVGAFQTCMEDPVTFWHQDSSSCRICPLAGRCR